VSNLRNSDFRPTYNLAVIAAVAVGVVDVVDYIPESPDGTGFAHAFDFSAVVAAVAAVAAAAVDTVGSAFGRIAAVERPRHALLGIPFSIVALAFRGGRGHTNTVSLSLQSVRKNVYYIHTNKHTRA
jgi:hypothetical protein